MDATWRSPTSPLKLAMLGNVLAVTQRKADSGARSGILPGA